MDHLRCPTVRSKAILMVLVSLATIMMTSAGSAKGFGFGIGTTQNQTSVQATFLTYTNANYGFTMKYPKDWTFNDTNPTNGGVTFGSPDRDGAVSVRLFSTNHTMEQYENTFLKTSNETNCSICKLLEFSTNTYYPGGHPAIRDIILYSDNTKTMSLQSIFGGIL